MSRGFYVCITWTWTNFQTLKYIVKISTSGFGKFLIFTQYYSLTFHVIFLQIILECRKIALFYKNLYTIYHLFCVGLLNLFLPTQTSDWTVHNSILLSDTIIMAGFPSKYSADELKEKLPEKTREGIQEVSLPVVHVHLWFTCWTPFIYQLNTFGLPVEHLLYMYTCCLPVKHLLYTFYTLLYTFSSPFIYFFRHHLYTCCASFLHLLNTCCTTFLHLLNTCCLPFLHLLYAFCPPFTPFVYLLSTFSTPFVYLLYTFTTFCIPVIHLFSSPELFWSPVIRLSVCL